MPTLRRACAECFKRKSKCVVRAGHDKCERCHRLNKRCVFSDVPRGSGGANTARAVVLEEKLDRLVAILENQQNGQSSSNASPAQDNAGFLEPISSPPPESRTGDPRHDSASGRLGPKSIITCRGEPSGDQADGYLTIFRTHMHRFFPAFRLPPEMSLQQLREEKPFLWLCIMCVACTSTAHQLVLGDSIKQIVAREIVYKSQKSIDFLLGLLVFIAWAHYQIRYMGFLSAFMQLATSIVYDLGLNRPTQTARGPNTFKPATEGRSSDARPTTPARGEKTMEERRAVLGCFLLSSTLAATLKRIDEMEWTPSMEESLVLLSDRSECPEDTILAVQVKLQLLVNQLDRSNCTWPFGNSRYAADTRRPPAYFLETVMEYLNQIRDAVPPELVESDVVLGHFHCTSLIIHEAFLSKPASPSSSLDLSRVERSTACVQSIKAWFDAFSAISPPTYVGFTFPYMCTLAYNLLALARFSTTEDAAWPKNSVRNAVDILDVCDYLIGHYQIVVAEHRTSDSDDEEDFFADCVKSFQCMRRVWGRELDGAGDGAGNGDDMPFQQEDLDNMSFGFATEWMDGPFWADFLNS